MFRPLYLLLICLYAFASCERIEVESQQPQAPTPTKPQKPTPTPTPNNDSITAYSIVEAKQLLGTEQAVYVIGYIVGTIEGTSLGKANFTPPFANQSNLLIADNPTERAPEHCLPIALPANTNVRAELNLKNNPSLVGHQLIVLGIIKPYFRIAGIPTLQGYELITTPTPQPTPSPTPTPPNKDTTKAIVYPTIDTTLTDTLISRSRLFRVPMLRQNIP